MGGAGIVNGESYSEDVAVFEPVRLISVKLKYYPHLFNNFKGSQTSVFNWSRSQYRQSNGNAFISFKYATTSEPSNLC